LRSLSREGEGARAGEFKEEKWLDGVEGGEEAGKGKAGWLFAKKGDRKPKVFQKGKNVQWGGKPSTAGSPWRSQRRRRQT